MTSVRDTDHIMQDYHARTSGDHGGWIRGGNVDDLIADVRQVRRHAPAVPEEELPMMDDETLKELQKIYTKNPGGTPLGKASDPSGVPGGVLDDGSGKEKYDSCRVRLWADPNGTGSNTGWVGTGDYDYSTYFKSGSWGSGKAANDKITSVELGPYTDLYIYIDSGFSGGVMHFHNGKDAVKIWNLHEINSKKFDDKVSAYRVRPGKWDSLQTWDTSSAPSDIGFFFRYRCILSGGSYTSWVDNGYACGTDSLSSSYKPVIGIQFDYSGPGLLQLNSYVGSSWQGWKSPGLVSGNTTGTTAIKAIKWQWVYAPYANNEKEPKIVTDFQLKSAGWYTMYGMNQIAGDTQTSDVCTAVRFTLDTKDIPDIGDIVNYVYKPIYIKSVGNSSYAFDNAGRYNGGGTVRIWTHGNLKYRPNKLMCFDNLGHLICWYNRNSMLYCSDIKQGAKPTIIGYAGNESKLNGPLGRWRMTHDGCIMPLGATGMCLDVTGSTYKDDTPIQLCVCHLHSGHRWTIVEQTGIGDLSKWLGHTVRFQVKNSTGYYLDSRGAQTGKADSKYVGVWSKETGSYKNNQLWIINPDGQITNAGNTAYHLREGSKAGTESLFAIYYTECVQSDDKWTKWIMSGNTLKTIEQPRLLTYYLSCNTSSPKDGTNVYTRLGSYGWNVVPEDGFNPDKWYDSSSGVKSTGTIYNTCYNCTSLTVTSAGSTATTSGGIGSDVSPNAVCESSECASKDGAPTVRTISDGYIFDKVSEDITDPGPRDDVSNPFYTYLANELNKPEKLSIDTIDVNPVVKGGNGMSGDVYLHVQLPEAGMPPEYSRYVMMDTFRASHKFDILWTLTEFIKQDQMVYYYPAHKDTTRPEFKPLNVLTDPFNSLYWNIQRDFGSSITACQNTAKQITNYFLHTIDKLIDYVITNDIRVPTKDFHNLWASLFGNGTTLYSYAMGTLLLPTMVNWLAEHCYGSAENPLYLAEDFVTYVPKDLLLFPDTVGTPWEKTVKWAQGDSTTTKKLEEIVVTHDYNGYAMNSCKGPWPFAVPLSTQKNPNLIANPTAKTTRYDHYAPIDSFNNGDKYKYSETAVMSASGTEYLMRKLTNEGAGKDIFKTGQTLAAGSVSTCQERLKNAELSAGPEEVTMIVTDTSKFLKQDTSDFTANRTGAKKQSDYKYKCKVFSSSYGPGRDSHPTFSSSKVKTFYYMTDDEISKNNIEAAKKQFKEANALPGAGMINFQLDLKLKPTGLPSTERQSRRYVDPAHWNDRVYGERKTHWDPGWLCSNIDYYTYCEDGCIGTKYFDGRKRPDKMTTYWTANWTWEEIRIGTFVTYHGTLGRLTVTKDAPEFDPTVMTACTCLFKTTVGLQCVTKRTVDTWRNLVICTQAERFVLQAIREVVESDLNMLLMAKSDFVFGDAARKLIGTTVKSDNALVYFDIPIAPPLLKTNGGMFFKSFYGSRFEINNLVDPYSVSVDQSIANACEKTWKDDDGREYTCQEVAEIFPIPNRPCVINSMQTTEADEHIIDRITHVVMRSLSENISEESEISNYCIMIRLPSNPKGLFDLIYTKSKSDSVIISGNYATFQQTLLEKLKIDTIPDGVLMIVFDDFYTGARQSFLSGMTQLATVSIPMLKINGNLKLEIDTRVNSHYAHLWFKPADGLTFVPNRKSAINEYPVLDIQYQMNDTAKLPDFMTARKLM